MPVAFRGRGPSIIWGCHAGVADRTRNAAGADAMKKLFSFVGATILSSIGWWMGAQVGGIFAAFVVSMVGTGVGMYAGYRLAENIDS
jgi:ABC-type multidrug transport system permease subunit